MKTDKPAYTNTKIEYHRQLLEQAVIKHGLTSSAALDISETLDKLIIDEIVIKMAVSAE